MMALVLMGLRQTRMGVFPREEQIMKKTLLTLIIIFSATSHANPKRTDTCAAQRQFVLEFLKLENDGGRLKTKSKIYSLTTDAEDAVWDTAWVVSDYRIDSCETIGHDSIVNINYKIIGSISSSEGGFPVFTEEVKNETVAFHVTKKIGHWKISDVSHLRPHVSVTAAIDTVNQITQLNSFDPAYGKNAQKTIGLIQSATSQDRMPASN